MDPSAAETEAGKIAAGLRSLTENTPLELLPRITTEVLRLSLPRSVRWADEVEADEPPAENDPVVSDDYLPKLYSQMYRMLITNKQYNDAQKAIIDRTMEIYDENAQKWRQLARDKRSEAVKETLNKAGMTKIKDLELAQQAIRQRNNLNRRIGVIFAQLQEPRTYSSFLSSFVDDLYQSCCEYRCAFQDLFPPSALKRIMDRRMQHSQHSNVDGRSVFDCFYVLMDISVATMLTIIDDSDYDDDSHHASKWIWEKIKKVQTVALARRWTVFDDEDIITVPGARPCQLLRNILTTTNAVQDLIHCNWDVQKTLNVKHSIIHWTVVTAIAEELERNKEQNESLKKRHAGPPYDKKDVAKWFSTLLLRFDADDDFAFEVQFYDKKPKERQMQRTRRRETNLHSQVAQAERTAKKAEKQTYIDATRKGK